MMPTILPTAAPMQHRAPSLILTPVQMQLRMEARRFAREIIMPAAIECDREYRYLPMDICEDLNRRFGKIAIPREFGGDGHDMVAVALVCEELSYADLGANAVWGGNNLGLLPIVLFGNETLRARFEQELRNDTQGKLFMCLAGTEPQAGSDIVSVSRTGEGLHTVAKKVDGGWIINGQKKFISNGPIATYATTWCATERGPTVLVVDTKSPGFTIGKHFRKLGNRCSPVSELIYKDVFVPDDCLVGEPGQGGHVLDSTLSIARPGLAMASAGVARRAYDIVLDYCRNRIQGGRRLIEHQAVQLRIARIAARVEAIRALALNTWIKLEDTQRADEKLALLTKTYCTETASEVVAEAMTLLGGNGYMMDHPIEKLYRDIKLNELGEGENNYLSIVLGQRIAEEGVDEDDIERIYHDTKPSTHLSGQNGNRPALRGNRAAKG